LLVIVCSLNEVESYGRRAARGSGMHWGLAEEAGKAARWLAERNMPGAQLLACLLTANRERNYEDMAPVITGNRWKAANGELCPVCSGAALRDRIDLLTRDQEVRLSAVAYPLLLIPFLDQSWRPDGATYVLRWGDIRVSVSAGDVALECCEDSVLLSERADEVTVQMGATRTAQPTQQPRSVAVGTPISTWRALDALAKRTYVAASEESRARGAGAGSADND
jgi:hypothetical protein